MKHVTYADKSLLVGDEVADLLIEYAAELGHQGDSDSVTVHGYGADSDEVAATYLLSGSANVMAESTHTSIPEPDNSEAVAYLKEHIDGLRNPRLAAVEEFHPFHSFDSRDSDRYDG